MSTGVTPALVHSSRTNRDASCPRLPACHGIRLLCLKGKPLWKPRKRRIPRTREVVAQSSADDFSRERQRPRQKSQRFTDPANGSGNWPPSGQRDDAFFDDEDIVDTRTPPMQNMRGRMGNGVAARDGSGKLGPGGRGGGNRYAPVQGAGVPARPGSQGGYPDGNPATTGRVPPPRLGRRTGYGMVYGGSMEEDDFFGDPSRKGGRQSEGDANDLDAPLSAEEILLLGVDVDVDSARRQAGGWPADDYDLGDLDLPARGRGALGGDSAWPRGRGRPVRGVTGRSLAEAGLAGGSRQPTDAMARGIGSNAQGARGVGKGSRWVLDQYGEEEGEQEYSMDDDEDDIEDEEDEEDYEEGDEDDSSGLWTKPIVPTPVPQRGRPTGPTSPAGGSITASGIPRASSSGGNSVIQGVAASAAAAPVDPRAAPSGVGEAPALRRRGRPRKDVGSGSAAASPTPSSSSPASLLPLTASRNMDIPAGIPPTRAASATSPAAPPAPASMPVSATSSDEMEVTKSAGSGTHQPKEEATLTSSSPSRGHMPDASGASTTDGPSSTTSRVLATPALSAAKHGSSTPTSPPVSRIIKSELTVGSMVDRIARGKLDVAPRFQRNYVWKLPAASKLVESVFMFAPIPTIFCCLGEDGQTWEVVDGKQRLTSLWSFVKGEFPDGRPFVLNGLEVLPELNDKSFQDLDDAQRETLLDYSLSVHLLPAADLDPDYVFEVFERLNMGGMQLNAQELRNCMYHGKYKDLVEELVMHPLMRDICRSPVPQPRMKDHELILRFFALLRNTPVNYRGPMKQWLNREARDFRNPSTEDVVVMRYEFTRVLKAAHRIFGENAFRVIRDDPPTTGPLPGEVSARRAHK
eukprot:jgi/Mesvir1/2262/Mv19308-RA.5